MRLRRLSLLASGVALLAGAASAASAATFITLGTQGGPVPSPTKSQPANLLVDGDDVSLVDAGDGAAERMAAAGFPLVALKRVFISHLHFDHTGGLGAILGLRYATSATGQLVVYGPPGTRELVAGLVASMKPTSEAGYGVPGEIRPNPEAMVTVVELSGGERLKVAGMTVSTAENSHYSFPPGSDLARRYKSLSIRFDLPGQSIVYTGDTGPSPAVERLAKDSDLLVAEMIDLPATVAGIHAQRPDMPKPVVDQMVKHLSAHHLTPDQVGELAARANVKRLVVTHLAGGVTAAAPDYVIAIRQHFSGPVTIANDLDRFQ